MACMCNRHDCPECMGPIVQIRRNFNTTSIKIPLWPKVTHIIESKDSSLYESRTLELTSISTTLNLLFSRSKIIHNADKVPNLGDILVKEMKIVKSLIGKEIRRENERVKFAKKMDGES